jgi:hypothetical protein
MYIYILLKTHFCIVTLVYHDIVVSFHCCIVTLLYHSSPIAVVASRMYHELDPDEVERALDVSDLYSVPNKPGMRKVSGGSWWGRGAW